jgi:hypothetical protein
VHRGDKCLPANTLPSRESFLPNTGSSPVAQLIADKQRAT